MRVMDMNGNECTERRELDFIYEICERFPLISSIGGVLTPPEIISLARWCVTDGLPTPGR